jgi:lipopolysaccharide transport system permease protein
METRIYESSKKYSLLSILGASWSGFRNSRFLARQLATRDLRAQYRQSFLGFFWAFAPILINAAVWIVLRGTGTVQLAETPVSYPLFVVIGTTLWTIFSESLSAPILAVNGNKSIITKINFDKEALIILSIIKVSVNSLIKFILVVALLFYYSPSISSSVLFFIPLLLLSIIFFLSIGVLLTPIGVLYQDIGRAIPMLMQVLMYVTPVVYVMPESGWMKTIMSYNPFTYIVTDIRNSLTGLPIEHWNGHIGIGVAGLLLAMLALIVYRISIPIITERMSS